MWPRTWIYVHRIKAGSQREHCALRFPAALPTVARRWKQMSFDGQISVWCVDRHWNAAQTLEKGDSEGFWEPYSRWNEPLRDGCCLCAYTDMTFPYPESRKLNCGWQELGGKEQGVAVDGHLVSAHIVAKLGISENDLIALYVLANLLRDQDQLKFLARAWHDSRTARQVVITRIQLCSETESSMS